MTSGGAAPLRPCKINELLGVAWDLNRPPVSRIIVKSARIHMQVLLREMCMSHASTRYVCHACMRAQVHTYTTCMHFLTILTRLQGGCASPPEGCLLPAV